VGPYRARIWLGDQPGDRDENTTTSPVLPAGYEELVGALPDAVALTRAEITFTRGALEGQSVLLSRMRAVLGGPGADIVLDPNLPKAAVKIRVVRGRVMVEPGDAASLLAGVRVRELVPAIPGEEIRVGEHAFTVNVKTIEDREDDLTNFGEMVGQSPGMRRLFGMLARMAAHDDAVLLTGESGTGKELAARALHSAGPRHDGPFVAVNCAAIADALFESELFGHEKGSFTGAAQRQDGAFQQANRGTLFLDEVGELKLDAQAKLLRALESGEVRRVGATAPEFPDVRIVAATNRHLPDMVKQGLFRSDLFFRLSVLTVRLPPLRERKEDLRILARALTARVNPGARLTEDACRALESYDWPGNVRELRNVLTRAFVMSGPNISAASLEFHPWAFDGEPPAAPAAPPSTGPKSHPPSNPQLDDIERRELLAALARNGQNRTRTARELGIPRSSLLYRMQRLGIE
jgi:two-component system response regulator HydG